MLQQFASISAELHRNPQNRAPTLASVDFDETSWASEMRGWSYRFELDPHIKQAYDGHFSYFLALLMRAPA